MSKKPMNNPHNNLVYDALNRISNTPISQKDIIELYGTGGMLSDSANAITNIGGVTFTEISTILERIDKRETVDTHMLKLIIKYYKEFIINDLSTEEHLTNEQILLKAYLEGQK